MEHFEHQPLGADAAQALSLGQRRRQLADSIAALESAHAAVPRFATKLNSGVPGAYASRTGDGRLRAASPARIASINARLDEIATAKADLARLDKQIATLKKKAASK